MKVELLEEGQAGLLRGVDLKYLVVAMLIVVRLRWKQLAIPWGKWLGGQISTHQDEVVRPAGEGSRVEVRWGEVRWVLDFDRRQARPFQVARLQGSLGPRCSRQRKCFACSVC